MPLAATFELDPKSTMDILSRIRALKEEWRLEEDVCGGLVAYFESMYDHRD